MLHGWYILLLSKASMGWAPGGLFGEVLFDILLYPRALGQPWAIFTMESIHSSHADNSLAALLSQVTLENFLPGISLGIVNFSKAKLKLQEPGHLTLNYSSSDPKSAASPKSVSNDTTVSWLARLTTWDIPALLFS